MDILEEANHIAKEEEKKNGVLMPSSFFEYLQTLAASAPPDDVSEAGICKHLFAIREDLQAILQDQGLLQEESDTPWLKRGDSRKGRVEKEFKP